jgi:hypothetical protein
MLFLVRKINPEQPESTYTHLNNSDSDSEDGNDKELEEAV